MEGFVDRSEEFKASTLRDQHSSWVVSTVTSQREGPGVHSRMRRLEGRSVWSLDLLCLRGFPPSFSRFPPKQITDV